MFMVLDIFQKRKKDILSKLDKSSKHSWDKKIISLCEKINKNKDYYTTSSCSGRVVLNKDLDKKEPGVFLWVSHEQIKLEKLKEVLVGLHGNVIFKQEPVILHVACKTLKNAQEIVDKAKLVGFKRSGIIASKSRFVCELLSTEKLELPVIENNKLLVSDSFLKIIIKKSNENIKKGWVKIEKLKKQF